MSFSLAKPTGRTALGMGVSFFPALSSFFSNFHIPSPDYLWRYSTSDQAETARLQAQSEQTEAETASRPDSPTHSYSFKRGWPRKFSLSASSWSSCASGAEDEGGDVDPHLAKDQFGRVASCQGSIRILPRINSEEFYPLELEEAVDECTHAMAASSLQAMLPHDEYYDRYRDEDYNSCRTKQADQVLDLKEASTAGKALHSAICSPKDLACAHGGIAVALASETVNVKGKPVEIYNVVQPDSSGPAAAGGAVQAGDYERQQRDFSHSCT